MGRRLAVGAGVAAALLAAAPAGAQLPPTAAASLGTAGNYTALARGFSAIAVNPANLALPGNPAYSLTLLPVEVEWGLAPIGFGTLADYEGKRVPESTRLDWLRAIRGAGRLTGDSGAEASEMALTAHRFGFQVSTVGHARAVLNPDAAEVILFGNAGRTGAPGAYDLAGSRVDGFLATTFAASYAQELPVALGPEGSVFAAGATAKITVGHALVVGRDAGGRIGDDPVDVNVAFPVIAPGTDFNAGNSGTGFGLDVGAALESGRWTAGAAVQNLVQTFKWKLRDHTYRPGDAFFNGDSSSTDFDERPLAEAPAFLRNAVDGLGFRPKVILDGAYRVRPDLDVTGEFRHRFGDGLRLEEKTHLGAGAEYRPAKRLPLRAGLAVVDGGMQLAGGAGIAFGGFRVEGAVLAQTGSEKLTRVAAGVSYGAW